MKKHFILLKCHKTTGLKYLCYHYGTHDSYHSYLGSGVYWKCHLNKHGRDIFTEIIAECSSREEARDIGLKYSIDYDIVKSNEYANLMVEDARSSFSEDGTCNKERIKKSHESRAVRRKTIGLTDAEIENHKRLANLSKNTSKTLKYYDSLERRKSRYKESNYTEKEQKRIESERARKKLKKFTEREIDGFKKSSQKMSNVTMKERIGDPDWQHPKSKQYHLFVNDSFYCFIESVSCLINNHKLSWTIINNLRSGNHHRIKRQSNTKHLFKKDDILILLPV